MQRGERHMVNRYEGFNAAPGGSVFISNNPFGENYQLQNLLKDK